MNIKKNTGAFDGYTITQTIDGKFHSFSVVDYGIDPNKEYEFRLITKCRAGFMTISERTGTIDRVVTGYKKGALQTVEMKLEFENDKSLFVNIFAMKGNKFYIVDKAILECLRVGDIHYSFPKMADFNHWKKIGTKTHADPAYGNIEELANEPMTVVLV